MLFYLMNIFFLMYFEALSYNVGCFHCQVVSAMVNNDLLSIVNTRPLKFWKETLALLCSVSFITPGGKKCCFCDIARYCLQI